MYLQQQIENSHSFFRLQKSQKLNNTLNDSFIKQIQKLTNQNKFQITNGSQLIFYGSQYNINKQTVPVKINKSLNEKTNKISSKSISFTKAKRYEQSEDKLQQQLKIFQNNYYSNSQNQKSLSKQNQKGLKFQKSKKLLQQIVQTPGVGSYTINENQLKRGIKFNQTQKFFDLSPNLLGTQGVNYETPSVGKYNIDSRFGKNNLTSLKKKKQKMSISNTNKPEQIKLCKTQMRITQQAKRNDSNKSPLFLYKIR